MVISSETMNLPEKYIYPAVFTYEEGYEIAVTFPDLPGCTSSGATEAEALAMGREALGLHLWSMEQDHDDIPPATPFMAVDLEENERAVLIEVYMPAIRLSQTNA